MRKNQESMSPTTSVIHSEEGFTSPEPGSNGHLPESESNGHFVDTIRERAYRLYEARMAGNSFGDPLSDWLQAEHEVRTTFSHGNDVLT